jgi:hypothetical protein
MSNKKSRAIDAARILNMLRLELIVGTRSLEIFNKILPHRELGGAAEQGMIRMCHFHFLLSLCKFVEFYDHYHSIIPEDCKQQFKGAVREINKKGIIEFRNKYIGHILEKRTGRPLDLINIETYLHRIYGNDDEVFIAWINDHKNIFPTTVVSVVEHTRTRIMESYSISDIDINTSVDSGCSD